MRNAVISSIFAAVAMAAAPAFATTYTLGNLTGAGTVSRTASFSALSVTAFTDYFTFSVGTTSSVGGTTTETDGYVKFLGVTLKVKDLEVNTLSLSKSNGTGGWTSIAGSTDVTPESFFFSPLATGSYRLTVKGTVLPTLSVAGSGTASNGAKSSYTLTASAAPVASAAPEASDLALTALGLAGVGFWSRRRKAA